MSRPFSMATVLRRTPYKMLRWFLPSLGLDLGLDWENLHAYDVPKVIKAYEEVPEQERQRIENELQEIFFLADKEGVAALREAARLDKIYYWDVIFQPNASAYYQVIWAWSKHHATFEKAKKLLQSNRSPNSYQRAGLPIGTPPLTCDTIAKLKQDLQLFFSERQKTEVVCTIETIERESGKINVLAYCDEPERPILQHNEREILYPNMIRPVSEIAFSVDGNEGTLSSSSKTAIREDLENLFIRAIYGIEPPKIEIPKYNIEILKDQNFRFMTDAKDCLKIDISFIKLFWSSTNGVSYFQAKRDDDIFRTVNHLLEREKRSLGESQVLAGTVRFQFLPNPARRAGILCVEFTSNHRYEMRCKDATRTDIMLNYLKKWKIIL